jgi:predicted enzyme involved in methoxymalonyl-ACP biosynthesis
MIVSQKILHKNGTASLDINHYCQGCRVLNMYVGAAAMFEQQEENADHMFV